MKKKTKNKRVSIQFFVFEHYISDISTIPQTEELGINIQKDITTSTFTLRIPMAPIFFKFLIGKKSATKNKIQQETGCTLVIPKPESTEEEIGTCCLDTFWVTLISAQRTNRAVSRLCQNSHWFDHRFCTLSDDFSYTYVGYACTTTNALCFNTTNQQDSAVKSTTVLLFAGFKFIKTNWQNNSNANRASNRIVSLIAIAALDTGDAEVIQWRVYFESDRVIKEVFCQMLRFVQHKVLSGISSRVRDYEWWSTDHGCTLHERLLTIITLTVFSAWVW